MCPVNRLWAPALIRLAHYRQFFTPTAFVYTNTKVYLITVRPCGFYIVYLFNNNIACWIFRARSFLKRPGTRQPLGVWQQEPDSPLTSSHPLHPLPSIQFLNPVNHNTRLWALIATFLLCFSPFFFGVFQRIYSVCSVFEIFSQFSLLTSHFSPFKTHIFTVTNLHFLATLHHIWTHSLYFPTLSLQYASEIHEIEGFWIFI